MKPADFAPALKSSLQTILGIDFGLKRIGLAVGQTITRTASPLETLQLSSTVLDVKLLDPVIAQWKPNAIVIGHPLHADQSESSLSTLIKHFAENLQTHTRLPVFLEDEYLSSHEAQNLLREQRQSGKKTKKNSKADIDKLAAALILQRWLNRLENA